jgi:hypothetical protein
MRKEFAPVILVVALAASLTAQAAQQAKGTKTVAGKWTMSVDSPHGATTMGLVLEQEGKKVTGTFASPHGDFPVEGEFADRTLKLATTTHGADSPEMTLNAKLKDNGTLAGYLSSSMGDMMWTAERAKE